MADDNRERQAEELQGIAAIYPVNIVRPAGVADPNDLALDDDAHWPAGGVVAAVTVPVGEAEAVMTATLPRGYPGDAAAALTVSFPALQSKAREEALAGAIRDAVLSDVGFEQLMPAVMQLVEDGEAVLDEIKTDAAAAAEKKAAAQAAAAGGPPVRCWFHTDHMLQGRQHKKELECVDILQASGMTGCIYYGHPSIIVLEGPQSAIDDAARRCRKAGKSLTIKKTQSMPDGVKSQLWAKFAAIAPAQGRLDKDALTRDVERAGIAHKLKFLLGIEDVA